jgi:hypothetical protein
MDPVGRRFFIDAASVIRVTPCGVAVRSSNKVLIQRSTDEAVFDANGSHGPGVMDTVLGNLGPKVPSPWSWSRLPTFPFCDD